VEFDLSTAPPDGRLFMNGSTGNLESKRVRRGRVLVVDEEARLGKELAEALIEHDFVTVRSGADALAVIAVGRSFDLVLCALVLRDMSGMDVLFHLCREHPDQAERLVFMAHSGTSAQPHVFDGVSNLCIDVPSDMDGLRALIERRTRTFSSALLG
jgi:two-component system, NtrC family, sensor kinase